MRLTVACLLAMALAGPAWSQVPAEFEGTWTVLMPEVVGKPEPRNQLWRMTCAKDAGCTLTAPVAPKPMVYRSGPSMGDSLMGQARSALKYARERSAQAIEQEPWLAPLLESKAEPATCIELTDERTRDIPGMYLLCRLDRNPWPEPVVLFMGTITADCGPAFCRFALLPMFRQP